VWTGPHPLEVFFGAVGLAIAGLAVNSRALRARPEQPETTPQ
jgi:hypothetical protein